MSIPHRRPNVTDNLVATYQRPGSQNRWSNHIHSGSLSGTGTEKEHGKGTRAKFHCV